MLQVFTFEDIYQAHRAVTLRLAEYSALLELKAHNPKETDFIDSALSQLMDPTSYRQLHAVCSLATTRLSPQRLVNLEFWGENAYTSLSKRLTEAHPDVSQQVFKPNGNWPGLYHEYRSLIKQVEDNSERLMSEIDKLERRKCADGLRNIRAICLI